MTLDLNAILAKLDTVRPCGAGWTARCPAHDDRHPSLSVRLSRSGWIVFHCFAGCTHAEVAAALGLGDVPAVARSSAASRRKEPESISPERLAALVDRCRKAAEVRLEHFASPLGLSAASLRRQQCGWGEGFYCTRCECRGEALTFPMRMRPHGSPTGVRLRFCRCAHKRSLRGAGKGLFIPDGLSGTGPLIFPEGPTTNCAWLDLGFDSIGRLSADGGIPSIVALLQNTGTGRDLRTGRKREIVVGADNDQPKRKADGTEFYPGQEGAQKTALAIAAAGWPVRIVQPPRADVNDVRAWFKLGVTRAVANCVIRNASYVVAPKERRACA